MNHKYHGENKPRLWVDALEDEHLNHWKCGDDEPCIWIKTLISGLSRESRERKRYLMLQTAFDDSGKDAVSTSFTLAGYFGSPEQLMDLAHDWDDELKRELALDYVKVMKHSACIRSLPDGPKRPATNAC